MKSREIELLYQFNICLTLLFHPIFHISISLFPITIFFFGVSDYRCGEERDGEKKIKDER